MMHTFFKRKLAIIGFTFLLLFIVEVSLFIIVYSQFFARTFVMELGLIIILLSPAFLFKSNKITIAYCSIWVGALLSLYLLNVTLDAYSRDIFSLAYISSAREAAHIFDVSYLNFLAIGGFVLFTTIYVFGLIGIYKLFKEKNNEKPVRYLPKGAIITLGLLLIGMTGEVTSYNYVENYYSHSTVYKNKNGYQIVQYLSKYLKKTAMKNYGVFSFSFASLGSTATEAEAAGEIDEYLALTKDLSETAVTDEYFGLLKDYNVIEIMIETGSEFLINEYLTPNLYKLANEGIYFENNFSKNKTNISEFIGLSSVGTTNLEFMDVSAPYALPNMLKKEGYKTSYFHNNDGAFYGRDKEMPMLGFDNVYFMNEINEEHAWSKFDGNYPLDSWTMEDILDRLAPANSDKPYYSFYTTLSMHGPYTGQIHKQWFTEMGYYKKIEAAKILGLYENPCKDDPEVVQNQVELLQCAAMNLDEGIGLLIKHLKDTNQFDNTLLVLYGDHECYYSVGIDNPLKEYVFNCIDDETNPSQYETMMIFYNEALVNKYKEVNDLRAQEKAVYNDFTSPYIVVPTVLELLGVNYNPGLYTGTSIFQTTTELDNIFYSNELGCLFSNKAYLIGLYEDFSYLSSDANEIYQDLFMEKSEKFLTKLSILDKMYQKGYFGQ